MLSVKGFPTVLAFKKGVEVNRFYSVQNSLFIHKFIDDSMFTEDRF